MRYAIVAIGSRGDVQPYVALALGLLERGHTATVMAHENFRDFVLGYGIGFHPLEGSVEGLLKTDEGLAMLRSGNILSFVRYLRRVIAKTQKKVNQDIMAGAVPADVVLTSLLGIPWVDAIAEKLQKPWAIVQLNLPTTRTAAFPLAALDFFDFPLYNRLTYRLLEFFHWRNNRTPLNAFRQSIGLLPLREPVLKKIAAGKILNLHCFSPALRARPADWPAEIRITGFLFLPPEKRAANTRDDIAADLALWLAAGEAPVYIGFGSIPVPDAPLFQQVLGELLRSTSHRFIFCQGWSMPMKLPEDSRLFLTEAVNHDWLFPRCRSAVIHGGVGTTAAVLKAGIPVIVVSIIADQPWWGKIIASRGVGVHIPFRQLTAKKLIRALADTERPAMKERAKALGERLSREDGLAETLNQLESHFRLAPVPAILPPTPKTNGAA